MRQDDDVRKTNGIRFKGINQQDLRKRLGCQQEWNKPGRLGQLQERRILYRM